LTVLLGIRPEFGGLFRCLVGRAWLANTWMTHSRKTRQMEDELDNIILLVVVVVVVARSLNPCGCGCGCPVLESLWGVSLLGTLRRSVSLNIRLHNWQATSEEAERWKRSTRIKKGIYPSKTLRWFWVFPVGYWVGKVYFEIYDGLTNYKDVLTN
jgi:hypothetical protein